MTVLEVIQKSSEFLAKKGVESPRLQVELLLAEVLKLPRMKLYLNFERVLSSDELEKLRQFVVRRGQREPLQHIIGNTSFCGLDIKVDSHVLIPRPETEILAERGWTFLSTIKDETPVAMDFGTGSGCIAIALAVNCPGAEVHAVDISNDALTIARQNAERHNVAGRIHFHHGNGFAALPKDLRFHLIAGNPPYIATQEIETLDPEVRDHDPRTALDGGADGLDFYRRIAVEGREFLLPGGQIILEFGDGQSAAIREIFEGHGWVTESIVQDYTHRDRFFVGRLSAQ